MSDRFQELAVFVRAAETGSFSRAARELGLSQPSVSRIVGALEARLGVKLLLRTTRRVTPTAAGATFLGRAQQLLHELDEAADAARGMDSLRGVIRIALPIAFGARMVIPHLGAFLGAHPLLRLELMMSDALQDLVAEGADVALRLGHLADSGFGARWLAAAPRLVVASPTYVAARGAPKVPADLASHDCIAGPVGWPRQRWEFARGGVMLAVDVEGRIQATAAEGVLACAKAGLGIAIASLWMCRAELDSGALVALLGDYDLAPIDVHAVFPGGPHPSTKVRGLVDHLAAALARPDEIR